MMSYLNDKCSLTDLLRKPDVIVIGETHTDIKHNSKEAKLIRKYKPEYVLLEALNENKEEDTAQINQIYKFTTLKEVLEKLKMDNLLVDKKVFSAIDKEFEESIKNRTKFYIEECEVQADKAAKKAFKDTKRDGIIPKSYKRLLETPIYELNPLVVDALYYLVHEKSEMIGDEMRKRGASINEIYKNLSKLNGLNNLLYHFRRVDVGERGMDRVYQACADVNTKIVGCDNEKIKSSRPRLKFNTDFTKEEASEEDAKALLGYVGSVCSYLKENNSQREQTMGEKIAYYVKQRKTDTPIIAIVGRQHSGRESDIYNILDKADIKYKIIKQHTPFWRKNKAIDMLYGLKLGIES